MSGERQDSSDAGARHGVWRRGKRQQWGGFDGAPRYEQKIGGLAHEIDRGVVLRLLDCRDLSTLDLPCGAGRMSVELATTLPSRLVSADFSPGMLAVARRRLANPLLRCDAFALPFADATFDRALTLRLVFHYSDPEPILAEIARVLRPGGEMVFDTLNTFSTRHAAELVLRAARPHRRSAGLEFQPRARVREMLDRVGLVLVDSESRYLLPTRSYRFLPRPLARALVALERVVPAARRVLTYWHVARPE